MKDNGKTWPSVRRHIKSVFQSGVPQGGFPEWSTESHVNQLYWSVKEIGPGSILRLGFNISQSLSAQLYLHLPPYIRMLSDSYNHDGRHSSTGLIATVWVAYKKRQEGLDRLRHRFVSLSVVQLKISTAFYFLCWPVMTLWLLCLLGPQDLPLWHSFTHWLRFLGV